MIRGLALKFYVMLASELIAPFFCAIHSSLFFSMLLCTIKSIFVGLLLCAATSFWIKLFFLIIKGRRCPIFGIISCFGGCTKLSDTFFILNKLFRSRERLASYSINTCFLVIMRICFAGVKFWRASRLC